MSSEEAYLNLQMSVRAATLNASDMMEEWNKLNEHEIEKLSGDLEDIIEALQSLEGWARYREPIEHLQRILKEGRETLDETLHICKSYVEAMASEPGMRSARNS